MKNLLSKVRAFQEEAHRILATHEASISRVITIEDTYRALTGLSLRQNGLFREALTCVHHGLYRAAHVIAWAAFMDFLEEAMFSHYSASIASVRPKWSIRSVDDLREQAPEHQLIQVCQEVGLVNKNQAKALHGLLNRRNECAHPSDYHPSLNETLGFVSELLSRITTLQLKLEP